jgi:light-regulated signal transduction histidine kinase (bacteriophytochrome)
MEQLHERSVGYNLMKKTHPHTDAIAEQQRRWGCSSRVCLSFRHGAYEHAKGRKTFKYPYKDEEDKFTSSVTDNAVGFDMKYVEKLFCVFRGLHAQDKFEGTDIGLGNVRLIVSRHGGGVWTEGAVGQGGSFSFPLLKTGEI